MGAAITGGMGGGHHESAPVEQQAQAAPQPIYGQQSMYGQQPMQQHDQMQGGACQYELKQFLDCAQNQYDFTICQGFNEALKQCKLANGEYSTSMICHNVGFIPN